MNNYIDNINMLMQMGINPQQIIQTVVGQNPQLQQVFSQLGPNMSAKQMCIQIAQQRGIDLNPIISYMQQRGMKL